MKQERSFVTLIAVAVSLCLAVKSAHTEPVREPWHSSLNRQVAVPLIKGTLYNVQVTITCRMGYAANSISMRM